MLQVRDSESDVAPILMLISVCLTTCQGRVPGFLVLDAGSTLCLNAKSESVVLGMPHMFRLNSQRQSRKGADVASAAEHLRAICFDAEGTLLGVACHATLHQFSASLLHLHFKTSWHLLRRTCGDIRIVEQSELAQVPRPSRRGFCT